MSMCSGRSDLSLFAYRLNGLCTRRLKFGMRCYLVHDSSSHAKSCSLRERPGQRLQTEVKRHRCANRLDPAQTPQKLSYSFWFWTLQMDFSQTSTYYLPFLPRQIICGLQNTVKPLLVVTSIKQPTCIKQPEEGCPKIHKLIYLNCIKQPPAFSNHILSFPWVAA